MKYLLSIHVEMNSNSNLNENSLKFYLRKNIPIQPLSKEDFNFKDETPCANFCDGKEKGNITFLCKIAIRARKGIMRR